MPGTHAHAGATLTIDLDAIAANWRQLDGRAGEAMCAAVVKADAYGLGAARVVPALAAAGCPTFFTATIHEALAIQPLVGDADIGVFFGVNSASDAAACAAHGLLPVLNHLGQVEAWSAQARSTGTPQPAMLHVDTGMTRLGMPADEARTLAREPARLAGCPLAAVLSHLACAEEAGNPMNRDQLARFRDLRDALSPLTGAGTHWSLANSSGVFLGPDYHFGMVRPGAALYGLNPQPGTPNPMAEVIRLQGKILQVQHVDSPQTVGYGAAHVVTGPARVATVGVGYADGYLRSGSGRASARLGEFTVPVIGRVSMDLITLDISAVPEHASQPGACVDLIGGAYSADALAVDTGTIGYEILTSLGRRYRRRYVGDAAGSTAS